MEKFLIFAVIILMIPQKYEQKNVSELRKEIKRQAYDYNPNTMIYPDQLSSTKIRSRNCTFGICETVLDYPTEKIQKLIDRSVNIKKYFENQVPIVFDSRLSEGENLCAIKSYTVFPKSATNIKGTEQLVVNVDDYQQGVNFETCENVDKACKYTDTFPDDYTTACEQKYTIRKLMAISKETHQPIFDNFKMPSCCVCTIKKNI
nr:spaetzle-1 protein [Altica viridicyanea]